MSEKFNLSWNDFKDSVSGSFKILRDEKDFFDVTLVTDDEISIEAHKVVLSASSPFFKNMLRKSQKSHPLVYLSGVHSRDLQFVMDYVYQGQIQIYQDHLDSFMDCAKKLKISGQTFHPLQDHDCHQSEDNLGKTGENVRNARSSSAVIAALSAKTPW